MYRRHDIDIWFVPFEQLESFPRPTLASKVRCVDGDCDAARMLRCMTRRGHFTTAAAARAATDHKRSDWPSFEDMRSGCEKQLRQQTRVAHARFCQEDIETSWDGNRSFGVVILPVHSDDGGDSSRLQCRRRLLTHSVSQSVSLPPLQLHGFFHSSQFTVEVSRPLCWL